MFHFYLLFEYSLIECFMKWQDEPLLVFDGGNYLIKTLLTTN